MFYLNILSSQSFIPRIMCMIILDNTDTTEPPEYDEFLTLLQNISYHYNTDMSTRLLAVPRGNNKTSRRAKKYFKQFKNNTFHTNAWDSTWLEMMKKYEYPFDRAISQEELLNLLHKAISNYKVVFTDKSYMFYGNRERTISLAEFIYHDGRSMFWEYLVKPLEKGQDDSWCEEYLKDLPTDLIYFARSSKLSDNQIKIRIARLLKWYRENRKKGDLTQTIPGTLDTRKLFLGKYRDWWIEEGRWRVIVSYPSLENEGFKVFIKYLERFGVNYKGG